MCQLSIAKLIDDMMSPVVQRKLLTSPEQIIEAVRKELFELPDWSFFPACPESTGTGETVVIYETQPCKGGDHGDLERIRFDADCGGGIGLYFFLDERYDHVHPLTGSVYIELKDGQEFGLKQAVLNQMSKAEKPEHIWGIEHNF